MRKKLRFMAMLSLAGLFFAACNAPETKTGTEEKPATEAKTTTVDMAALRTDIQAMEDAFAAGEKARSVDAVAAYYADDAVSYNRNQPPSVGMAAIKEKIAKGFAKDTSASYNVYKIVDLFAAGNMATEIGSWTKMNAAGEKVENGYYTSYFEKRGDKYKCVRDMSVTESPAIPKK